MIVSTCPRNLCIKQKLDAYAGRQKSNSWWENEYNTVKERGPDANLKARWSETSSSLGQQANSMHTMDNKVQIIILCIKS